MELPVATVSRSGGQADTDRARGAIVARTQVGNPRVAWFQYQPLYDLIVREQPDLLD